MFETILISANDTLVDLFLKKISFYEIYEKLNYVIELREFKKLEKAKNIDQILELSNKVRLKTQSLIVISRN